MMCTFLYRLLCAVSSNILIPRDENITTNWYSTSFDLITVNAGIAATEY